MSEWARELKKVRVVRGFPIGKGEGRLEKVRPMCLSRGNRHPGIWTLRARQLQLNYHDTSHRLSFLSVSLGSMKALEIHERARWRRTWLA
jgi:hypothetical protein